MLITTGTDYEAFTERGAIGVQRKTFVDQSAGSRRFVLRYYVLQPGGQTPHDIHPYEHIVIVTKGEGTVLTVSDDVPTMRYIKAGDIVYIGVKEPHQFLNTGTGTFEFHCFRGATELYTPAVEQALQAASPAGG